MEMILPFPRRKRWLPTLSPPMRFKSILGNNIAGSSHSSSALRPSPFRYFNVFGPKQDPDSLYAAVIPKFIDALVKGDSPVVFGDGEQSRDLSSSRISFRQIFCHVNRSSLWGGRQCRLWKWPLPKPSSDASVRDLLRVRRSVPSIEEPRPGT